MPDASEPEVPALDVPKTGGAAGVEAADAAALESFDVPGRASASATSGLSDDEGKKVDRPEEEPYTEPETGAELGTEESERLDPYTPPEPETGAELGTEESERLDPYTPPEPETGAELGTEELERLEPYTPPEPETGAELGAVERPVGEP
ncbi:hypothetical protein L083_0330 [Actinoplanes sp. N902-109]|nr:hypothetical protein L083_0330 [Actinoplanes sp. N902-109]